MKVRRWGEWCDVFRQAILSNMVGEKGACGWRRVGTKIFVRGAVCDGEGSPREAG